MKMNKSITSLTVLLPAFTGAFLLPNPVFGHCDTLSGPVVAAARSALETGNINRVLIWVQQRDEAEIKRTFQRTMAVRKLNPDAKDLADMYFFETVVRIHRAGEGAPYTGLKPTDTDLGPAIPCADKTIETGKVEKLLTLLTSATKEGLEEHFQNVVSRRKFNVDDVAAGREYVEAYVTYTHYVERIYEAARHSVEGHYPEAERDPGHKD
jgi:hypothetical protein